MNRSRATGSSFNETVLCIVLIAFLSACTTNHPLARTDAQVLQEKLQIGDEVEILRKDGREASFKIDKIDSSGVGGEGIYVVFSDIDEISVGKTSITKSVLLGVGILIGVILLALLSIDEDDIFNFNPQ